MPVTFPLMLSEQGLPTSASSHCSFVSWSTLCLPHPNGMGLWASTPPSISSRILHTSPFCCQPPFTSYSTLVSSFILRSIIKLLATIYIQPATSTLFTDLQEKGHTAKNLLSRWKNQGFRDCMQKRKLANLDSKYMAEIDLLPAYSSHQRE